MSKILKTLLLIVISCMAYNAVQAQERILEDILQPDSLFFCNNATFSVKVVIRVSKNDTFRIRYQLGNRQPVEELVNQSVRIEGDSLHYTFKTPVTIPANLNDTLRITLITQDPPSLNNQRFIVLRKAPVYTLPFVQDFEQKLFPPLDWSVTSVGYYDAGWIPFSLSIDGKATQTAKFYEGYVARYGTLPAERNVAYMMLPALSLKNQKNPYITFDLAQQFEPFLTFGIEISTDCGTSFKNIYTREGRNATYDTWPYKQSDFIKDSIDLTAFIDSTVLIRFYAKHGNKDSEVYGPILDNIRVYDVPILDKNAALSKIISPVLYNFCSSKPNFSIEIEVKNEGKLPIDTFIVSYKMGTTPSVSDTIVHTLARHETYKHTFLKMAEIPQNGVINLTTTVKINGEQDIRNDTRTLNDVTFPRYNLTYSEDFESPYSPPLNFPSTSTTNIWFNANRTVTGSNGLPTKAPSSILLGNNQRIQMILPFLDLRNNKQPFLTFDVAYPKLDTTILKGNYRRQDTLRVQISTDCGKSNKIIYEKKGDNLTTSNQIANTYSMEWTPNSALDWRRDTVFLNDWKDSVVLIRFVGLVGGYGSIFLDNFKLESGFNYDMGILNKQSPSSELICANERKAIPVRLTIQNNAFLAADSVKLSYQLDTEGIVSETLIKRINPRDTVQYQFRQLMNVATIGKHNLTVFIQYLNDENSKNDTLKTTFTIGNEYNPNILEEFEAAAFPPIDWQIRSTKAKMWDRALAIGTHKNEYTNTVVSGRGLSYTDWGTMSSLISLPVNLSNTEKPVLIFDRFVPLIGSEEMKDSLIIDVSLDCGTTFKSIGYVRTGNSLATIKDRRFEPSSSADWATDTVDLSVFKGSTIQVRFTRIYNGAPAFYFDNIQFVNILRQNLSLISVQNPVETTPLCRDNPFIVTLNLRNDGTQPIDSFTIKYQIDNENTVEETRKFTLPAGTSAIYPTSFSVKGLSEGQHAMRIQVKLIGDTDNVLDTLTHNLVIRGSIKAPIYEDFNVGTTFPPRGWLVQSSSTNTWKKETVISKYGISTPAAYFNSNNNEASKQGLVSVPIDLKGVVKPRLLFDIACARFNDASNDTLMVEISTDCGVNYDKIYLKNGSNLATSSNWSSPSQWLPTAFLWRTDTVNLTQYAEKNVLLRFLNIGNSGQQLYLDDIRVADSSAIVKTQEVELSLFSKIFPNPTSENIVIELAKTQAEPIKLELINSQGQVVKSENKYSWDTPQYQWSLQGLPSGMYLLNIYNHQKMAQHKVILMK